MKLYLQDSGEPTLAKIVAMRGILNRLTPNDPWSSQIIRDMLTDARRRAVLVASRLESHPAEIAATELKAAHINVTLLPEDAAAPERVPIADDTPEEPQVNEPRGLAPDPEPEDDMTRAVNLAMRMLAYSDGSPMIAAARIISIGQMTDDPETFSNALSILCGAFPFIEPELPSDGLLDPEDEE